MSEKFANEDDAKVSRGLAWRNAHASSWVYQSAVAETLHWLRANRGLISSRRHCRNPADGLGTLDRRSSSVAL